eukprot:3631296-Rhodomonas_salina.3
MSTSKLPLFSVDTSESAIPVCRYSQPPSLESVPTFPDRIWLALVGWIWIPQRHWTLPSHEHDPPSYTKNEAVRMLLTKPPCAALNRSVTTVYQRLRHVSRNRSAHTPGAFGVGSQFQPCSEKKDDGLSCTHATPEPSRPPLPEEYTMVETTLALERTYEKLEPALPSSPS